MTEIKKVRMYDVQVHSKIMGVYRWTSTIKRNVPYPIAKVAKDVFNKRFHQFLKIVPNGTT